MPATGPPPFQGTPLQQIFYQPVPVPQSAPASPSYIPLPSRPRLLRVPRVQRAVWVPLPPLSVPPPPTYLAEPIYKRLRFRSRGRRLGADLVILQPVPPTPAVSVRRRGLPVKKGRSFAPPVTPAVVPNPPIVFTGWVRRRGLLARKTRTADPPVAAAAVIPNPPIRFTSWVRRRGLVVRRGLSWLPWPQAPKPVASIGQLTAADRGPGNTATAVGPGDTSSSSATAALTARDQRTGGPQ